MSRPADVRDALAWTGVWALLMAVAVWTRPHLPVDETRYLAVAWEMWLRQDWLVPHLNGAPYSHKPPLLFWLMNLGWAVFGVNDWWPRLVAPAFGLGSLFLTARLARDLWPGAPGISRTAPLLLLGALFWTLYTSLTMFDMMLAFFTLLGLLGLVAAGRAYSRGISAWRGFAVLGLAIGLGVLAKGPAILLHLLPVALAAPWWLPALAGGITVPWGRWYRGVLAAVLLGAALALVWAVWAGIAGGAEYREAIFWGQSAGRMVKSFAHGRSWWWYLAMLPPLILPWLVWPRLWRVWWRRPAPGTDGATRLIAVWFGVTFVAFSLISGKQLHYLLPEFPALALLAARWLEGGREDPARRWDLALPAAVFALLGAALIALPLLPDLVRLPEGGGIDGAWGMLPLAACVALLALPASGSPWRPLALSVAGVVAVHLALAPMLGAGFDMRPVGRELARWQAEGYDIAHSAKYHGQYNFAGRLRRPVATIGLDKKETEAWMAAHPKAKIISYRKRLPERWQPGAAPDLVLPFRSRYVLVWDAGIARANPGIADRGS